MFGLPPPGIGEILDTLVAVRWRRLDAMIDKKSDINKKPDPDTEPDWTGSCEVCGQSPILPATGMCGPCTFGEADTVGGNW